MSKRDSESLFGASFFIGCLTALVLTLTGSIWAANPRVLLLTKVVEFDHKTQAVSAALVRDLGSKNGFDVDVSDTTGAYFKDSASLAKYAALILINTSGNIFSDAEASTFQKYMHGGGGFVGMHEASDCQHGSLYYGKMVGAVFQGHPQNSYITAKVSVRQKLAPFTDFITQDTFSREEEWYFWTKSPYIFYGTPRDPIVDPADTLHDSVHVLLDLVESSLPGSNPSHDHPVCWYHQYDAGRIWYTSFGHDAKSYSSDPMVRQMLLGGIRYAAKMATPASVAAPPKVRSVVTKLSVSTDRRNLQFSGSLSGAWNLTLFTLEGRRIQSSVVWGARTTLDNSLDPGMYLWSLQGSGSPLQGRLLVE